MCGRRSPAPAAQLDAAWISVVRQLRLGVPLIVGGRSSGARVAENCAAELERDSDAFSEGERGPTPAPLFRRRRIIELGELGEQPAVPLGDARESEARRLDTLSQSVPTLLAERDRAGVKVAAHATHHRLKLKLELELPLDHARRAAEAVAAVEPEPGDLSTDRRSRLDVPLRAPAHCRFDPRL